MTIGILDYISNGATLDEKCRCLEQCLRQTGQSISLHMTGQGKLELCGQWNDIVKTQDVLNRWIEYIQRRKSVEDLTEFISRQILHSSDDVSDRSTKSPQVAASANLDSGDLSPNMGLNVTCSRLIQQETKPHKTEVSCFPQPRSRPKRNIKHKILPLLKSRRKHFDTTMSSESDDGDLDMIPLKKVKQETRDAEIVKLYDDCCTDIAKSEDPPDNIRTNGVQACILKNKQLWKDTKIITDQNISKTSSLTELNSLDDQVKESKIGLVPSTEPIQVCVKKDDDGKYSRITDPDMKNLIRRDGEYYKCSECSYRTLAGSNIKLHVARVHLPKSFQCDQCNKRYALHKDLLSHKTVHTRPHPCHLCGMSFSKPYLLRQHTRCRHEGTPKKRGRKPGTKNIKVCESVPLSCKHCDYVTFTNWNLVTHLQRVHAEKIYKCIECNSAFGLMKDLNQHTKAIHMSRFECSHCKKILKSAYSLKMHVKVIHEGVKLPPPKSYQCHLCGKVCRNKTDYVVHTNKYHLNIRPFKCQQCGMQFFAKSNLTAHQLIHSDQARFVCPECGKRFKQRQGLRVHRYIHKSADDRPFKCTSCNKVFTQKGALVRHQRVHSGFRPYLCKFDPKNCNAAFNDYSILRRHLQGIHKVHDVEELRQAVQKACDESREMITGQLKATSCLAIQDKSSCRKRKEILYEQKQQSRNLKYSNKKKEQYESILIKVKSEGNSQSEDVQLSCVQNILSRSNIKLITSSQQDVVSQTQQLQDFVYEFGSQLTAVSSQDAKVQFCGNIETSDTARSLVKVMYLTESNSMKQGEAVMIHDEDSSRRIPESLEEAVSEALDVQPTESLSNLVETGHNNMESSPAASVDGENSKGMTVALQPIVNLQSLLQAQVANTSESPCQMLNLHGYSEPQLLDSGGQDSQHEEMSSTGATEVILEQVENPSSQIRVAVLADVGQQLLQNIESSDETEHIIVITSVPGDQQPDINAILSMYHQSSTCVSEDQSTSLMIEQEHLYTPTLVPDNEVPGVIETLITQNQQQ